MGIFLSFRLNILLIWSKYGRLADAAATVAYHFYHCGQMKMLDQMEVMAVMGVMLYWRFVNKHER